MFVCRDAFRFLESENQLEREATITRERELAASSPHVVDIKYKYFTTDARAVAGGE